MAWGRIIQLAYRGLKTRDIKYNEDEIGVDRNYVIRIAYYFIQVCRYYVFIRLAVVNCGCLKNHTLSCYEAVTSQKLYKFNCMTQ